MDATRSLTRESISQDVIAIIQSMISDWDLGPDVSVGLDTCLVADLDCESIDIVQLIVSLQEHYEQRDLPFERLLMSEERYVDEIYVRDIVDFLVKYLNGGEIP
jgi:acyl carrier protein